ncbi:DUF11 domain-containing protein [Romboutsia sp.]|uniref:DUF11 domain-containing protein n=1 Tax=Romboutsia sp. TaxID=1965302 RepID=UPI003F345C4B
MKINNECRINYQYRLSSYSPIIMKTVCSNTVSTDIIRCMLKVDKYVDKKYTSAFDILTYTIVIKNISKLFITKIFFQDKIPKGTRFIENSVTVDGFERRCVNIECGFYIGNLKAEGEAKITFKTITLPSCFSHIIKNYSTIEYDYIFNVEKCPARICMESNNVTTFYEDRTFKQISVDNEIKVHQNINNILNTKVEIKVLDVKILNTPINESYLTKNIKSCSILVICRVEYEVLFSYYRKTKNRKFENCSKTSIKEVFGFANYMIVPVGITYVNKNSIKIFIENISSNLLDCETIYISTSILMHY